MLTNTPNKWQGKGKGEHERLDNDKHDNDKHVSPIMAWFGLIVPPNYRSCTSHLGPYQGKPQCARVGISDSQLVVVHLFPVKPS